MKCPKCGHQRAGSEPVPAWQCPACGIAYNKFQSPSSSPACPPRQDSTEITPKVTFSPGVTFRKVRILLLTLILIGVALDSWLTAMRATDWEDSLWVVVYPINADGGPETARYLTTLNDATFAPIQDFFSDQAKHYGVGLRRPVEMRLGPVLKQHPPLPPVHGNVLEVMWWSLRLRYWSAVNDDYDGPRPDIRVFVLFNKPEKGKRLPHSTGLKKGMVSVVHAFASSDMAGSNNVVITHEMLHTLGATDKYDLTTGQPIYPQGYAEPGREPLYPQRYAEIMGGYIPRSRAESSIPESLGQTLVGAATAREIGWQEVH